MNTKTVMNRKAVMTVLAAGAVAFGVAACGSSAPAPGVAPAPSAGLTEEQVSTTPTTPTTPSTSTATTAATTTPTSGPLSREPVVVIPKRPPPKHLVTKDIIVGTGATAKTGSQVSVNYVGKLYDNGKTFDSSWKDTPGKAFGPFQLGAGAVIKGWDQGLVGMKVGGRRELIIPPELAYGAAGQPPTIPKNATLVFVVDMLAAN
jgi:peptidylprolyl isomerase